MSKVKVILIKPGEKYGEETEIENKLNVFQDIVGGYIEHLKLRRDFSLLCNEEGRLRNLKPSLRILGTEFVGNIIIIGEREEEFSDVPLSLEEWKKFVDDNQRSRFE